MNVDYARLFRFARRSLAMYYYTVPTGRAPKRILFPADPSFVHEATP